jgi:hypothetical protein
MTAFSGEYPDFCVSAKLLCNHLCQSKNKPLEQLRQSHIAVKLHVISDVGA